MKCSANELLSATASWMSPESVRASRRQPLPQLPFQLTSPEVLATCTLEPAPTVPT